MEGRVEAAVGALLSLLTLPSVLSPHYNRDEESLFLNVTVKNSNYFLYACIMSKAF